MFSFVYMCYILDSLYGGSMNVLTDMTQNFLLSQWDSFVTDMNMRLTFDWICRFRLYLVSYRLSKIVTCNVFMFVKLRFTSFMDVLTCLVVDSWCHKIGHVGTFRWHIFASKQTLIFILWLKTWSWGYFCTCTYELLMAQ